MNEEALRGNLRTCSIDAMGHRTSQMLPSLYHETQTDTMEYTVCERVRLYNEAHLLALALAGKAAGLVEKLWV